MSDESSLSSVSDIEFDDREVRNDVAREADVLEKRNLTDLLIGERLRHESETNYDQAVLDVLDLIGNEKDQQQAVSNRSVRELLKTRQKELPITEQNDPFKLQQEVPSVLKLNDEEDDATQFESLPVWKQFGVETSPYTLHINTRPKRVKAYEDYHKKLRFFERLHEEVIGLLGWLEPSDIEIELRRRAVARVEHLARRIWPEADCQVFGSVASGLILPTGDIDINITGIPVNEDKVNLRLLANHLISWKLVRCMETVLGAKVPIIKAMDVVTEYPIDITLNQPSSSQTTKFVKRQCRLHPHLRPMILIIKVYLQQRNLAETYHGGIGSYLLFCMCLGFLQQHKASSDPAIFATLSLGHLLFDFFQFYGHDHPYATMGISVRNGGELYLKKARNFYVHDRPYLLSVQSPLDPAVDVGKNSYNIPIVRDAFKKTYARLCFVYNKWANDDGLPVTDSILKEIIWPHDVLFTRNLPYTTIREKLRHYEASGGDASNPVFTLWLEKGPDFKGIAPYPSRINHISEPRPGLHIDDHLRKETKVHFNKFFDMVVKLRGLRREAINKNDIRMKRNDATQSATTHVIKQLPKPPIVSEVNMKSNTKRAREHDELQQPSSKKQKHASEKSPKKSSKKEGKTPEPDNGDGRLRDKKGSSKANNDEGRQVRSLQAEGVPGLSSVVTRTNKLGQRFEPLIGFLGVAVDHEEGDNVCLDSVGRQWSD